MLKDKLELTYSLTIRPDYASLIPIVAQMNGWNGEGDPKEFLSVFLNGYIKQYMKDLIDASLRGYYGASQSQLIASALLAYEDSAIIVESWTIIDED